MLVPGRSKPILPAQSDLCTYRVNCIAAAHSTSAKVFMWAGSNKMAGAPVNR